MLNRHKRSQWVWHFMCSNTSNNLTRTFIFIHFFLSYFNDRKFSTFFSTVFCVIFLLLFLCHWHLAWHGRFASDQNCVQTIYAKLSRLYNRIMRTHDNIDNMLESIRIWGRVPLYQRRESNANSLLDIDDRSLKCKTRCIEVNNSKKLIEFIMEENYRLLFDLPLLERKKEYGRDRFRNTIIRKFGRHQAKDKIERLPTLVRQFFYLSNFFFVNRFRFFLFSFSLCDYSGWITSNWCGFNQFIAHWAHLQEWRKFKAFSNVWRVCRPINFSSAA